MWANRSKREKFLLILLGLILFITIYYYYLYQPQQQKLKELTKKKEDLKMQLKHNLTIIKQLPELQQKYQLLQKVEKIELKFSSLTPEDFLELIDRIADDSGAKLTTYLPEEKADFTEITIIMEGSYRQLNSFLTGLKQLANQLEVKTLIITPSQDHLQMKMIINYNKK